MDPLSMISLGVGGLGAIGGLINSFSSGAKLNALMRQDPSYQTSPYAAQRLNMAQTLLNARMPGATAMERNIYGNQSNQLANVNRNATDSSQALALGSAAQGQTNQAFQNLGTQEQQDYYNRLQNETGAQQGMIQEGDKVYQDQVRRFQDRAALTGAQMQNVQGAWNSVANLGFGGVGALSFLNMNRGRGGNASPYTGIYNNAGGAYSMGMPTAQTSYGGNPVNSPNWINPYGAGPGVPEVWGPQPQ